MVGCVTYYENSRAPRSALVAGVFRIPWHLPVDDEAIRTLAEFRETRSLNWAASANYEGVHTDGNRLSSLWREREPLSRVTPRRAFLARSDRAVVSEALDVKSRAGLGEDLLGRGQSQGIETSLIRRCDKKTQNSLVHLRLFTIEIGPGSVVIIAVVL
jgi:hypothetical protein